MRSQKAATAAKRGGVHVKANRRGFLRMVAGAGVLVGCERKVAPRASEGPFPGKVADMVLHTERPPNLEMPERFLLHDLTPNEAMFVRWHESVLPGGVDEDAYRLKVEGHVEVPLELSLKELKARFEVVSVVAVNQCAGNGRAGFTPRVPGVQWGRGAVGNAKWTGVRLGDVLRRARPRAGAGAVVFSGMDHAPLETVPRFEKSLPMHTARDILATGTVSAALRIDSEPLLAWAMNGAPLPALNGYPLRLVVPGWYATYWVKSLQSVHVREGDFDGYWMAKAYRVPDDPRANESPDAPAKKTVPVGRMNARSIVVRPEAGERLRRGAMTEVQGLAWDGGSGIAKVEVSTDGGASWSAAQLDRDLGPYAWRRFRHVWMPGDAGPATVVVRATSTSGEQQDTAPRWNRSGYLKSDAERIDVQVG